MNPVRPLILAILICCAMGLLAAAPPPPPRGPQHHIKATATEVVDVAGDGFWNTPELTVVDWVWYAPMPPEIPNVQTEIRGTLTDIMYGQHGRVVKERSPLRRDVLFAHIVRPAERPNVSAVLAEYHAKLFTRELVKGPPTDPVPPLTDDERRDALSESALTNWGDSDFQDWLAIHDLEQGDTESDLDFARRVHEGIQRNYAYSFDPAQDRRLSSLIKAATSDCGGLSNLFVGILRANQIPARLRVGIRFDSPPPAPGPHVKADFYIDGVGWVPDEVCEAVQYKFDATLLKRNGNFFATDGVTILTLVVDTDVELDTIHFGIARVHWLQGFYGWVFASAGTGRDFVQDWRYSVTKLKKGK